MFFTILCQRDPLKEASFLFVGSPIPSCPEEFTERFGFYLVK